MGKHFDIGYFKKPVKVRGKVAKERTVLNKIKAQNICSVLINKKQPCIIIRIKYGGG